LDIARAPKSKKGKYIGAAVGLAAIVGVSVALTRLEPAAPSVERATLWIDTVRRGTMVRQVRAPGTSETPLLELSNPDVQLQALEAERQLAAAEAELVNLKSSLETQRLQQQSTVAQTNTQYQEARRNAEVLAALDKKGLSSTNEVQRANEAAEELKARLDIERQRLALLTQNQKQQYDMQRANVERARGIAQFQRDRVTSMKVKSGEEGVLQEMNLELGQWVVPGQVLARVAQPGRLKAELRVPETQAKDVVLGQPVSIDTRNGIIPGRVIRIEPQSENGTVGVDVALEGPLPRGARPELSVDGTIEIERLTNVMYVGRPAYGQAESVVGLFRLDPEGQYARRVNVKLGRSSVNTIEVVQGLNVGDLVIISDVSQWDAQERLKLK
jgi:HlyD family secretion protein